MHTAIYCPNIVGRHARDAMTSWNRPDYNPSTNWELGEGTHKLLSRLPSVVTFFNLCSFNPPSCFTVFTVHLLNYFVGHQFLLLQLIFKFGAFSMPFSLGNKTVTRALINITFGVDPSWMTPRPPMGQASPKDPACLRASYILLLTKRFSWQNNAKLSIFFCRDSSEKKKKLRIQDRNLMRTDDDDDDHHHHR